MYGRELVVAVGVVGDVGGRLFTDGLSGVWVAEAVVVRVDVPGARVDRVFVDCAITVVVDAVAYLIRIWRYGGVIVVAVFAPELARDLAVAVDVPSNNLEGDACGSRGGQRIGHCQPEDMISHLQVLHIELGAAIAHRRQRRLGALR